MVSSVTATPNHYEVLGLASTASPDEIAKAYAAHMATFRLRPENALKRLASLSTAYETLRDPAKRSAYDASLGVNAEPVRREPSPFIAAAVPQPDARPHVGSFIAASLRQPVRKPEPEAPAVRAPETRPVAPAEPVSVVADEPVKRTIDRNHATIAAGVVGLAILALAISSPRPNADRLPAPATAAPQAVTVGLPPATAAPVAVVPQIVPPKSEAAAPREQATAEVTPQPSETPPAVASTPDQQPATQTAATEAPPASSADQTAAAPTQDNATAAPAPDAASTPATDTAKLPLGNATIARTIERIGYACGSVASTAAMDASGVFKVTCSSGDTYQATPVHGRYHFRKLGGQ